MFGYLMANTEVLSKEDKERYQAHYCGLCKRLGELHNGISRLTLTYDMTFISILLSSMYHEKENSGLKTCFIHPLRKHKYIFSNATDYAADLSIILAYYKCLDDWNDDNSRIALQKSRILQKEVDIAAQRLPRQYSAVKDGLAILREMEHSNELNPDLPANCFGTIMGELFIREEDEYCTTLRKMGAALGRFIYMIDAANDLKSDINKERYNPLISLMDTDFTPILHSLVGECTKEFEQMNLKQDLSIMRNILYSGIWIKYNNRKEAE